MNGKAAAARLRRQFKFTETGIWLALGRARRDGHWLHGNPAGPGYVFVTYRGGDDFSVEKQSGISTTSLARHTRMDYTSGNAKPRSNRNGEAIAMPPRGKRATAAPVEPEPEETEEVEAGPFDHHLTKDLSPTMQDYGDWFHENVADIEEMGKTDPGRLLALGSTLYPHFQKSDLNQKNRAARKAARESAAPAAAEEEEEAPATPARRGKPKAAAATPAPTRRGKAKATAGAPY